MQEAANPFIKRDLYSLQNTSFAAASTLAFRADLLYAQNIISRWHLASRHGMLGESTIEDLFLNQRLGESVSGGWKLISARTNPLKAQGFDQVFIRYEKNGMPRIMVAETKFGSGRLKPVEGGKVQQLSTEWLNARRIKLGSGYAQVASADVAFKTKIPKGCSFVLEVPVEGGGRVQFFRDSDGVICFSGTPEQLASAKKVARDAARILTNTNCDIKCRIFKVDASGRDLVISIADVDPSKINLSTKTTDLLANGKKYILEGVLDKKLSNKEILTAIEKRLKREIPGLTNADAEELTRDLAKKLKTGDFFKTELINVGETIALQSLKAAAASLIFDSFFQLITTKRIDVRKSTVSFLSVGAGSASGQTVAYFMLKNRIMYLYSLRLTRLAGIGGTKFVRGAISSSAGAAIAALVLAYGGSALGLYDIKQANRTAIASLSGTAVSGAVGVGVPALISHFGTCGTGAAISSLHGAAATNAVFAKLGFGTIASGGFGASGGVVVLGGIVAVTAVSVTLAVSFGINKYDESVDRKFYMKLTEAYNDSNAWTKIAERKIPSLYGF